jgi:hypothetical protein
VDGVIDTKTDQQHRENLEHWIERTDPAQVVRSENDADSVHPQDGSDDDHQREQSVCSRPTQGPQDAVTVARPGPVDEAEDGEDDQKGKAEQLAHFGSEVVGRGEQEEETEREEFDVT